MIGNVLLLFFAYHRKIVHLFFFGEGGGEYPKSLKADLEGQIPYRYEIRNVQYLRYFLSTTFCITRNNTPKVQRYL